MAVRPIRKGSTLLLWITHTRFGAAFVARLITQTIRSGVVSERRQIVESALDEVRDQAIGPREGVVFAGARDGHIGRGVGIDFFCCGGESAGKCC